MLHEQPKPRFYTDENGYMQLETVAQMHKRMQKERDDQYEEAISLIMTHGFTRQQAKYLQHIKTDLYKKIRTII